MGRLALGIVIAIGAGACVACAGSSSDRRSAPVPVGLYPPPATPLPTATATPGAPSPTFEILGASPTAPLIHQGESTQIDVRVAREGWDGPLRLQSCCSALVESTSWIPSGSDEGLVTFVASTEGMAAFDGESDWIRASHGDEWHEAYFSIRVFPRGDTMMLGDVRLVAMTSGASAAATIDSDDVVFLSYGTNAELTARHVTDGSADSSFGERGTVALPPAAEGSGALFSLVSDPEGRLTALGNAGHDRHFRAVRLLRDGTPDSGFGTNGVDDVAGVYGGSLTVDANDPTGRLYYPSGGIRMVDPDGRFDPTFGSLPYAPTLGDSDGVFVASATELDRRRLDGTLDPAFGGGGSVTWEWPSYFYDYETEFSTHSHPTPWRPIYDDAGDIVVPVSWSAWNGATLAVVARDGSGARLLRDKFGNVVIVNGDPALVPDGRGGLWVVAMLPIPDTPGPPGPRTFEVRDLAADGELDEDRPRTYFWFDETTGARFLATGRVGSDLVVAFVTGSGGVRTSWIAWVPLR